MNRHLTATTIALSLGLAATPASAILYDRCESTVADRISELGIDPTDVRGVRYFPKLAAQRASAIVRGVKAWVSLQSCEGSLVIDMTKECRIK